MKTPITTAFTATAGMIMAAAAAAPLAAQQAPAPAQSPAQPPADVQEGTVVYGSDGEQIGTVAGARGEMIYLKVGERAVPVARQAVTKGAKGATVPITRADLIAQFDQQIAAYEAKLDAALTQGTEVRTADNMALGQIATVADEAVQVTGDDGPVTLPRTALALDREGTVRVRATMEQVKQAMAEGSPSR